MRLVFSSFFTWLNAKGYIPKNPTVGHEPIKTEKRIKKPLSDEDLEKLTNEVITMRNKFSIKEVTHYFEDKFKFRKEIELKEREVQIRELALEAEIKTLKQNTKNADRSTGSSSSSGKTSAKSRIQQLWEADDD